MKKVIAVLLALMLMMGMVSLANAEDAINVYYLNGPTGIGMVKLMNDNDGTYNFIAAGAATEVVSAVASGSADIAAAPTNIAATLYNKTNGNVQLLALNTLGVLSVLTNSEEVKSVADLAGKKLYATGQGATPEYALNYILAANGLTDSVEVEYIAEHAELVTLAATGKADIVLLPEPFVTTLLTQAPDFHITLDVTQLFEEAAKLNGTDAVMSMGCILVRKEFAESHADQVAAFLEKYAESVAFVNAQVDEAAQMVEAQGIIPKAAVAKKAIPNCHIVCITGEEMKTQIQPFFQVLFDANPASVGGKLPGEDFYFIP